MAKMSRVDAYVAVAAIIIVSAGACIRKPVPVAPPPPTGCVSVGVEFEGPWTEDDAGIWRPKETRAVQRPCRE